MERFIQDLKYSLRMLRQQPAFEIFAQEMAGDLTEEQRAFLDEIGASDDE